MLVVVPVNTWQACNAWGGKSLYDFNSTAGSAAWRVSFDRPYGTYGAEDAWWTEVMLVAFLNRAGYDTSYVTDVDVQRDPGLMAGHRLIILGGHSEYWSPEFRDAPEAARSNGVNLAFFGANDGYWQIRYQDDNHTLYRHVVRVEPDGQPGTGLFRTLPIPRPECQLEGVQFGGGVGANHASPYTVMADRSQVSWLRGTGLVPGSTIPGPSSGSPRT